MQLIPDLLSVTPGSPPRLLSVEESQRRSLPSEHHQQEGTWQLLLVHLITKAPSYNGLGCSDLLSHLSYAFNTHRASSPALHTHPTHLLLCLLVLLTPLMDFLLVSCFLLTQTQKQASLFEQAVRYYPKYTISPVLQRKNILKPTYLHTLYFYGKVMTVF